MNAEDRTHSLKRTHRETASRIHLGLGQTEVECCLAKGDSKNTAGNSKRVADKLDAAEVEMKQ